MFSKRIIPESDAEELYNKICQLTERSAYEYPHFIADINKQLEDLDFSLRRSYSERGGEAFLILVNVKQDELTQLSTTYTADEIFYIRELFERIILADNEDYGISSVNALHLGQKLAIKSPTAKNITQRECQTVLDRLLEDKWIEYHCGVYIVDTRAIAELQSYFREQYAEAVKECAICLDMVTMGEYCQTSNCPVRLHKYCGDAHFGDSANPSCPQCAQAWSRENIFGLGLVAEDE
ncbi:hypothetical protein K501DRAFT_230922 [Backusella circina FSU 941]|nr:hypothetical protein K501DRAFT_230922 [Backusella circina FSU 941]